MKFSIRLLYLYLFSAIGLFITIIGLIRLIDLGMKIYIFHNADQYTYTKPMMLPEEKFASVSAELEERNQQLENVRNRQRETSGALAMILIGVPLYLYHWKTISKENKKNY